MNESTLNKILDYLFAAGWWKGIILLILIASSYTFYKIVIADKETREAFRSYIRKRSLKIGDDSIKNHKIISSKPSLMARVNNLNFSEAPLKTQIFRIFFRVKLEVDISKLKDFVKKDFSKLTKFELCEEHTSLLEDMRKTFNENIKPELEKMCERELSVITDYEFSIQNKALCAEKIYRYVMYSENGYDHAHNVRMELLIDIVDMIRESETMDNNNERNVEFLNNLYIFITHVILKAERDFRSFNGGIEKIFNSFIIKFTENNK